MRRVVLGALLIFPMGCGGTPVSPAPSSPTPIPSPAPSRPTTTFHITGIATDDDGNPVPGVQVRIYNALFGRPSTSITTTTDARGFYDATYEGDQLNASIVGEVVADLEGYESYNRYLQSGGTELVQNLRMYRTHRVSAGQPVSITVRPDDSSYGFDLEWVGRTVRVIAPGSGRLNVSLENTAGANRTGMEMVLFAGGPPTCCSRTASVQVSARQEVMVRALVVWTAADSHSFTLTTSITPE